MRQEEDEAWEVSEFFHFDELGMVSVIEHNQESATSLKAEREWLVNHSCVTASGIRALELLSRLPRRNWL